MLLLVCHAAVMPCSIHFLTTLTLPLSAALFPTAFSPPTALTPHAVHAAVLQASTPTDDGSPTPALADPLYPPFIQALSFLLRSRLRLSLNHSKTLHFQMPLPARHLHSITRLTPHLASSETVETAVYRLAGGPVGTVDGRRAWCLDLNTRHYHPRLHHFTAIAGVHVHSALLILHLNMRPSARFNHHLRAALPTVTARTPPRTSESSPFLQNIDWFLSGLIPPTPKIFGHYFAEIL